MLQNIYFPSYKFNSYTINKMEEVIEFAWKIFIAKFPTFVYPKKNLIKKLIWTLPDGHSL